MTLNVNSALTVKVQQSRTCLSLSLWRVNSANTVDVLMKPQAPTYF